MKIFIPYEDISSDESNRRLHSKCKTLLVYHIHHDREYCPTCNLWVGEGCKDPTDCQYCGQIPETPNPDWLSGA
jgi:hypothetical protein